MFWSRWKLSFLGSNHRHCDFDKKITVAVLGNHCRWPVKSLSLIFHETFPFGGMEITATYQRFLLQTLNTQCYGLSSWKRAHARKERSISAWAHKSVHFLSLRLYQYGSRIRSTMEMLVRPWFLVIRFEHEYVCDAHPLPSDSSGMHPFMFKLVMSSRSKS